jgi:arsenite methyltransferase
MVLHRIVGALSTLPIGGLYAGLERFVGNRDGTFGNDYDFGAFLSHLKTCKLVFIGEVHSVPAIAEFQTKVIKGLTPDENPSDARKLHVVMEHFSFEMQELLDDFSRGQLSYDDFQKKYYEIGVEGHDLEPYQAMLEHIQSNHTRVRLHAGFISKQYARQLMKNGESVTLSSAKAWLPPNMASLEGSAFHYNYFESLLTGRDLHMLATPSDRFQRIFKAQLIKDVAMAHRVNCLIREEPDEDQVVVIAGNGHVEYYQGVPERVLASLPHLVNHTCLVTCHGVESGELLRAEEVQSLMEGLQLGPPGSNPADFVYLFSDEAELPGNAIFPPQENISTIGSKEETRMAYDQVGATAHLKGNIKKAHAIMKYLNYSEEDIAVAGSDAYNFQGVGNPHRHANIQPGETVLDIGSGLGVDSFIAANKAGHRGRVIGIDLAAKEVSHAQRRAHERGLDIRFATADMEHMPLPDNSFDVVISNGAFCLAPNKAAAFAEVFRVLKPGGRMVVCTSTIQTEALQDGVEWPICMRMFIAKNLIKPLCEKLGFVEVEIDASDSKMVFELPLPEEDTELNPERYRVHGDSPAFSHLEKYDMDKICARVCVVAKKPNMTDPTTET